MTLKANQQSQITNQKFSLTLAAGLSLLSLCLAALSPVRGASATGDILLTEVTSSIEWQWEAQGGEFDPTAGLVLHYPMNGDGNDASGNNNHGIVTGATLVPDRFGNPDSAYGFDGTAHIEAQVNPAVDPNGDFTYAFWIRVDSLSNWSEGQWYLNATPGLSIPRVDFGSPESTNSMHWYVRYDNNSTPSAGVMAAGPLNVGPYVDVYVCRSCSHPDTAQACSWRAWIHGTKSTNTQRLDGRFPDLQPRAFLR